ncbi:hypothetical protein [Pedosphaera parvula]|uniref:Uncharacterized protein n=1 Tax=Pedosphaera parvula (strain Ellin514) TaxID=320771 RepID=B9XGY0_PEDPL|nr:hypothetical protein [Pedosphaera parvula]EEF60901.1 hypothetical protein Cflav_PD4070 [Pedosphaera parvula Ellin514]
MKFSNYPNEGWPVVSRALRGIALGFQGITAVAREVFSFKGSVFRGKNIGRLLVEVGSHRKVSEGIGRYRKVTLQVVPTYLVGNSSLSIYLPLPRKHGNLI